MKKDYQTHVFTSTYTADVSGVCSAMYELGGMTILHDPSGCNSTYTTHDEPRWFDTDSLMFVSGLDEITAVLGDDTVLIREAVLAAKDLKPRFITLCGASIPHIIAFDYRGVANLIEEETKIPVLAVETDGMKSYVSGVDLAMTRWLSKFADPEERKAPIPGSINLLGVTPLDFSVNANVSELQNTMERNGFFVNCCMAMGDSFENLQKAFRAQVNVVVSSAGRKTAQYMYRKGGIPYVEGIPIGKEQSAVLSQTIRKAASFFREPERDQEEDFAEGNILVIGEEIFAKSLAGAINMLPEKDRFHKKAYVLYPDIKEGIPEDDLIRKVRSSSVVIADPLYKVVMRDHAPDVFIGFAHEAYSGRIFRKQIPLFAGDCFDVRKLLASGKNTDAGS